MNGYEELANAIIVRAVRDYQKNPARRRRFVRKLEEAENRLKDAKTTKDGAIIHRAEARRNFYQSMVAQVDRDQLDIERFFKSGWYEFLTSLDRNVILEYLHIGAKE